MSKREPAVLLDDIRTALEKIERYTADVDREQFLADEKTIDAVVRTFAGSQGFIAVITMQPTGWVM